MKLKYVKHERIPLKGNSEFSEVWIHEQIKKDPTILGLGELTVLRSEKIQHAGGRLDMLLSDPENAIWYETEIMLGPTDPSHIIRCIEYWDIERRRYPAYEHVAVLVAEDVTARFLNVMSLLSGSIPLIAIQLNALQAGEQVLLHFTKVLDQREARTDLDSGAEEPEATRELWDSKVGKENMQTCDSILELARAVNPRLELKYKRGRVAICEAGSFFNVIVFFPKKSYVPCRMGSLSNAEQTVARAVEAGLDAELTKGKAMFRLRPKDVAENETLLKEVVQQTVKEHET